MVCELYPKKSKYDAGASRPSGANHSAILSVSNQCVVDLKFTQYVSCISIKLREGESNYCSQNTISRGTFLHSLLPLRDPPKSPLCRAK